MDPESELPEGECRALVPSERPAWILGQCGRETPALGTYAGAGVFPLLPDQDVQRVVLLQVEDAQHRHTVGPRHGVPPALSASSAVARDAAIGQSTWAPAME